MCVRGRNQVSCGALERLIMLCIKCGKEIADGSPYCNYCGKDQAAPKRTKRANGEGTIYKRGRTYTVEVRIYDPAQRRIKKGGFRTRSEALQAVSELRARLLGSTGINKEKQIATLSQLYTVWESSAAEKLSDSKKTAYKIARKRIDGICDAPISALTIGDLQDCVEGLTYYPAKDVKTLLSHLYKRACAQQDVPANLAQYIVLFDLIEEEPIPFDESELRAIWKAWDNGDLFAGYLLAMIYTSMMPGELLACERDNIDLKAQRIVGAGKKTRERKTKAIMLPDVILPVMKKLMEDGAQGKLVPQKKNRWYDEYHEFTNRVGIRDLPPYSCRHTTATALSLGDKVAPALITKAMRQKRASTTERYKHADEREVLSALNQLSESPITRR